jgi:hypothetical protein
MKGFQDRAPLVVGSDIWSPNRDNRLAMKLRNASAPVYQDLFSLLPNKPTSG